MELVGEGNGIFMPDISICNVIPHYGPLAMLLAP